MKSLIVILFIILAEIEIILRSFDANNMYYRDEITGTDMLILFIPIVGLVLYVYLKFFKNPQDSRNPEMSFNQFKKFFVVNPERFYLDYEEIVWYHMYHDFDIQIDFYTNFERVKAARLIKCYQKQKEKECHRKERNENSEKLYSEIRKDTAALEKRSQEELEEAKRELEKVKRELSRKGENSQ